MKKIIFIIFLFIASFTFFHITAEAKSATCAYSIGVNSDIYLKIHVDSSGSVTGEIVNGYGVLSVSGIDLSPANFTVEGTSNFTCISQVWTLASYSGGRATNYTVTWQYTAGYSTASLISSKSSVDNSDDGSALTAIRNCSYSGVVISYMSDGTLKYAFKGAYTNYTRSAGDITASDFKDGCIANVYIVTSGGNGGNYAAVFKSSTGGQSSNLESTGEELSANEIEEYYSYGEHGNNTNYTEQEDVILPFCTETAKIWKIIGYLVNALKVLVPAIIIVLGSLDLGKAVVAQNEEDIKKGMQLLIKRVIAGIIIFFIPTIINIVFKIVYTYSEGASGSSTCIECVTKPWGC